eukprot:gene25055-10910_t
MDRLELHPSPARGHRVEVVLPGDISDEDNRYSY